MVDVIQILKDKASSKSGSSLNFRRRRRKMNFQKIRRAFIFLLEAIFVMIIAYGIVHSFGKTVVNQGESMSPTIEAEDRLLMDRLIYRISEPKQNDIIVFYPTGNTHANASIKRIIGVPGDRIQIQNGRLYVNGELYTDVVNRENMDEAGLADSEILLSDSEYFVLGDNRNNSEDSRFETVGNVSSTDIVGKIWFNITASNFGLLE